MTATYNPSGPTEMLHTPSRPMPTGAVPQGTWPGGPSSGPVPTGPHALPPAFGGEAASRVTASGRTAQPPGPATGAVSGPATGGAPGPVTGGAPAPVPAASSTAPKRGGNTLSLVLGAAVVVLAIALAVFWIRSQRTAAPVATETPTPVSTPATAVPEPPATAPPPEASATPPVTTSPMPTAVASRPATETPTPGVTPASRGSSAAATPTSTTTPAAGQSDTRGTGARQAGAPTPTPTPTLTPTAAPTPEPEARGRATSTPPPDEHLAFPNVKLLTVIGKKASDQDVLLSFVGGQISVTAKNGGSAIVTIPYKVVVRGTYVKSREPRWDASLPSPTEKLDMPGLFRTGGRHWLTLQTRTAYVILRLEDANFERIIQAVEARSGIKVDRVSDK